jgi:anti-sigma factor RsiW
MSCDWAAKLDRYVDSELSGGELTEVEAHLRTCPACAADALSRLQLKRMTQAVGHRFSPRPVFRLKIEQSVGKAKAPRWTRRWLPAFAAAAALVLILISAAVWFEHSRGEQALGELADLHVSTLASANPVDVLSSDRHTVKPWFQGKLPFTFNLPELQNSPFKLIGGRLTYFQQSPGAQLLFEIRKHRISVFIFQDRAENEPLESRIRAPPEAGLQQRDLGRRRPPVLCGRRRRRPRRSQPQ